MSAIVLPCNIDALAGAVCAFGVFDGMHAGHRFIIGQALDAARQRDLPSAAITFDKDPDELFEPGKTAKLATDVERIRALSEAGVDEVVVFDFTSEFAAMEPLDFLDRVFGRYTPALLFVGKDFRFGSRAQGDVDLLKSWGAERGMEVKALDLFTSDGECVTSTAIRRLLAQGDVARAAHLLGHPYRLVGKVVSGRGEGRDMGFRTANLEVPASRLLVGEGVYACYAAVDGNVYKAAVSVGVSPTFEEASTADVEAHILDFDGNLYGRTLALSFIEYLRLMIKFDSVEELIATVKANIDWVREHL